MRPALRWRRADGTAWGVLLLNSGGLEVVATADRLTFRAVGGVLDLYVLVGPRPLDVLRQLAAVVGAPAMQPYWALGFHQSRCAARGGRAGDTGLGSGLGLGRCAAGCVANWVPRPPLRRPTAAGAAPLPAPAGMATGL